MAQPVNLINKNTKQARQGFMGFSWTVLFFGPIVALFRSDWKWFFIMLIVNIITFNIGALVFSFIYNKTHLKEMLQNGFNPEGSEDFVNSVYAYAGTVKPNFEE